MKLEITHGGSSMGLDATLFVYGPRAGDLEHPYVDLATRMNVFRP